MTRLLLVEDEDAIAAPLQRLLHREGFRVERVTTLAAARTAIERDRPEIVLLDLMLPDGDGVELLREIRSHDDLPIVILSARDEEVDRVLGLELGADDYVVKPFSAAEVAARLRAILRRREPGGRPVHVGALHIDPRSRTATIEGRPLRLTAKEFDLLHVLASRAGEVVRREEIMDAVWGIDWFGSTKSLDVHVSWLRRKLGEPPGAPVRLVTVRGVGFMFTEPAPRPEPAGGPRSG